MNLLAKVKLILGIKDRKLLEKPISELTIEETDQLFVQVLQDIKKTREIPNKLFQLIESFPEKERESIVYNLISIAEMRLRYDLELTSKLEQELYLRYDSKDELKRKTYSFAINYSDYKDKQIEKMLPYLNEAEIQAFVSSEGFLKFGLSLEQKKRVYKVLLDHGIDIGSEKLQKYYDNDIYKIGKEIEKYPIDQQIEFWKKKAEYGFSREDEEAFNSCLEKLDLIERVYFRLQIDQENYLSGYENFERLSIEEITQLVQTCYKKIPENRLEEYLEYKYSLEEIREILGGLPVEVIEETKIDKAIIQKQAGLAIGEYRNLQTNEEKDQFFIDLSIDILNECPWAFSESIKRIPKEILKTKVRQMEKFSTIFIQRFSPDEIYSFFEERKTNYSVYEIQALIGVIECKKIKELVFDKRFDETNVELLISTIIMKIEESSEEKQKQELKVFLYELLESFGKKEKSYNFRGIINVNDVKNIITNYPNIACFINYRDFSLSEMQALKETCQDEEKYNLNIISRALYRDDKTEQNQELLKKLKVDCFVNLLNTGNQKGIENDYSGYLRDIRNIKEIFDKLSDEAKIGFISNQEICWQIFEQKQEEYFLGKADRTGQLLRLYKTINDENMSKVENVGKEDKNIDYVKIRFRENLDVIYKYREKLMSLIEKNSTTLFTINYSLLRIFEDTDLEFFSKYHSLGRMYFKLSDISAEFCKKIVKELSSKIQYPEEMIVKVLECVKEIEDNTIEQLLETEPIDKIIYLMNTHPELFKSRKIYEVISSFEKAEHEYCDKKVNDPQSDLSDILDAYMRRFFNMTYEDASRKIRQYQSGLSELIKRYENKENLSIQEQQELSSLRQLLYIKEILQIKDIEVLRQCYAEFEKDSNISKPNYMESLMIEELVKSAYTKEKIEKLFVPQQGEQDEKIAYKGKEIAVYKPKDNWNMLVSVVGAYVKNSKACQNPKDEWNSPDKTVNHGICTSLIGNNNLSMARRKNNLIFGFCKLSPNSIKSEASYDLGTNSNDIRIMQFYASEFRTTEDLKNHVRYGHSELLIERRSEDCKTEKRQPDYIIAVNKIRECDKNAANEFGIPIVYISTKQIAEMESQKLDALMQKLDEEISVESLSQLVCQYHNNYAGLITLDQKACKKYFNPRKIEQYFEKTATSIDTIKDAQQRVELAQQYKTILLEEQEKRRGVEKKYIPFRFDEIIRKLDTIISKGVPSNTLDYIRVNDQELIGDKQIRTDFSVSINRGGKDEK